MQKWEKRIKYGLFLCACLLFTIQAGGCGDQEEGGQETVIGEIVVSDGNPTTREQYTTVEYGDVLRQDLYSATLTPYVEELSFAEDGIFLEYCVSLGDEVKEGQVLARTDTETIENTIKELQEKVDLLTADYEYQIATLQNDIAILEEEMAINYEALENMEYMTELYTQTCQNLGRQDKSKAACELEIKQLTQVYELELPYYQKKLAQAKAQLGSNTIVATCDGVVAELRSMAGGDKVSAGQACVAVADTSRYMAQGTYVGNSTMNKVERIYVFINGKEYEAEYIPMDSKVYKEIMAKGESAYSTYEIHTDEELSFGQSVVIVVQKESRENVLVVPYTGVKQEANSYYCYVKRGDTKEKVSIEVGLFDGMNYEVLSGLEKGDEVVIE